MNSEGAAKKVTFKSFMAPIRENNRKVEMKYLEKVPASADVPKGKVVVHNSVIPVAPLGLNGFRAWTQLAHDRIEVCPCDWAPNLGKHYRVRRSPPSE